MRKFYVILTVVLAMLVVPVALATSSSAAANDEHEFEADLEGFEEVPSISSTGSGQFTAELNEDETALTFSLTYSQLEGATTLFAHIHLGQFSVNGGVSAFLCGGGGKPACPTTGGTVTGTITATHVVGPEAQGIAPGEFAELVRAMRAGVTYANVHTNKHPGGEIRGQIDGDDD